MNPIAEILRRLEKYPVLEYESGDGYVTVRPVSEEGFTVGFHADGPAKEPYTVSFEGWHEHFSEANEALNCFAFGLSSECRLRVDERGGKAYKWTLETKESGTWIPDSTTGLLFFPFWRRRTVRYLQNDVIQEG